MIESILKGWRVWSWAIQDDVVHEGDHEPFLGWVPESTASYLGELFHRRGVDTDRLC